MARIEVHDTGQAEKQGFDYAWLSKGIPHTSTKTH